MYVVDASVLVADARPSEPYHADARSLLTQLATENVPIYLPMIALAEVAAALSRGVNQPMLAQRWVASLRSFSHIQIYSIDSVLGDQAASLAAQQRLRGCDAVYVALAQQRQAVLVTLDREQRERTPPDVMALTPSEILEELHLSNGGSEIK